MQEQQHVEIKKYPTKQSATFAGGTFATMALVDLLGHLGPTGLFISGIAGYVAWKHGPEIYDQVREMLPLLPALETESQSDLDTSVDHAQLERALDAHNDDTGAWDESWDSEDNDDYMPLFATKFLFSDVLKGFKPSLESIYLGHAADGEPIYVSAKDLCHVALAGATRHGKGALIRLIMSQLCALGLPVCLLTPHYMVFDREHNEDWTPYTPYLQRDPLACRDPRNIKKVLEWMTYKLLPTRKDRAALGGRVGKPYFFILDEVPDIVKEIPEASAMIAKLLREGAKYRIYLVVASQDFSVKTLGIEGEGSLRKCFLTVIYVGGDPISVRELLNLGSSKNGKVNQIAIDENELGKGSVIVRCATTRGPVHARSPYVDNESLYQLLGPSTFSEDNLSHTTEADSFPTISESGESGNSENEDGNDMEMAPEAEVSKVGNGVFPLHGKEIKQISRSALPISDEKLEMIKSMKERKFRDSDIASLVGLAGRKYGLYQHCLVYLGYKSAK